jgi:2-C-methyl-D-erythritol 4-phosphate cytidylyltransferase
MKRSVRRKLNAVASSAAVVVAAGSSSRLGGPVRKPFLPLRGRPLLAWSLRGLARIPGLRQVVIVVRPEDRLRAERAVRAAGLRPGLPVRFVAGGARRQDSVLNGLREVAAEAELVLVHDAARPFPSLPAIKEALRAAGKVGGAILALPVRETVKSVASGGGWPPRIAATIPRSGLWLAQTPQVFRRKLLLELSERLAREAPALEATDDASVLEHFGRPVALIESAGWNLKVTRREDLRLAATLVQAFRAGLGG